MELDGLEELQTLSAVTKVTQMLKNHLDLDHPDLVEFIIHLAKAARDLDDFNRLLDENDAQMTSDFVAQLYRIIITLDPPKRIKKDGSWDLITNDNESDAARFPALAMKNSDPNRTELKELEQKKDNELSDWARELLEREQAFNSGRDYRNRRNGHRSRYDRRYSSPSSDSDHRDHDRHRRSRSYERRKNRRRSLSPIKRHRSRERDSSYDSNYRRDRSRDKIKKKLEPLERNGIYYGEVVKIMKFGAFIGFKTSDGTRQGLVHISEILPGRRRINEVTDVLKLGQRVWVQVIGIAGDKISLSMKEVSQETGECIRDFPSRKDELDQVFGSRNDNITGLTVEDFTIGLDGRKQKLMSDVDKWEQQQLLNSGILNKTDKLNLTMQQDNIQTEEEFDIEINDKQPSFLKGQTTRSGIMLSPIKIVANPEGSLARTITTSMSMAKERKEIERAQEENFMNSRGDADKLDVLPPAFSNVNRGLNYVPEWKKDLGRSVGFGKRVELSIKDQRESLPIFKLRDSLLEAINKNTILIVVGETGSGKSTQIPQYLSESGYTCGNKKLKIGCTQPRRVAAMSVAKRVAEEVGCSVGEQVGYTIRFDDCTSNDTTIKFMTDGMLLREVLQDPLLEKYAAIMLDEAHERTIATDVLFALLKECSGKRTDFKLIVTSATLEAEKFSVYFNNSSIFTIPGRSFPVEILHAKEQESDYLEASLLTVLNIHLNEHPGDILLFLTGQEDIDTACRTLHERMKKLESMNPPPLIILPVYAALPSEMQSAIFDPAPPGCRKCVVATNIAEASLTIDGIFFVVDPGFAKVKHYNARTGMESLSIVPISQASAKQRAGRAGRTGPGKCYRLYTELAYRTEMIPTAIPEIQRTNLASVVIILKAMGINDFINFDFMDKPPIETLIDALDNLFHLGALDDDGLLTRLGRKMAEFPMDPNLSKMLLTSIDLGSSDEIITIISMLSVQNIFYRPQDKQSQADQARAKFIQPEGDHTTYLQVYNSWQKNNYSNLWCHENFIQHRALKRAQDVRKQLISIMDRYKFKVKSAGNYYERITKAICAGFFHHSSKRDPQEGYRTVLDQQQVYIHPSSALYRRSPEYVVYHELVMTTKEYMRDLTVVKGQWLLEVAPSMFKKSDHMSKSKINQKIEPLYNKFEEKDAWRLSKRRG